jgi:IclR family transcriptional regulator, acetate operon repressor
MRKPVVQKKPPYALGSVDKALQLIQTLRDTGSLRLVDAAQELDVSPSTAHRLLSMLVYRGFAIQDDSRTYLPGPSMGERPVIASSSLKLKNLVQPHLELLSEETGETANLMIRVGTSIRFLSTVESRNILRVGDRRGAVLPAARASGGKALLAELDDATLRRLFRIAEDGADEDFAALTAELERARRQGFASNFEATEDGVCAIGAALHDAGVGVGAISVSLPASRLTAEVRERLVDAVLLARRAIEDDLAVHPLAGSA